MECRVKMSTKKKHTYVINGKKYYKRRFRMPDGSFKFVYGYDYQDWLIKAQIKYDNFYNNTPEQIASDKILLKDEISAWLDSIKETCTQKTSDEYIWTVNKHLLPNIGKIKLVDVTTAVAIDLANKVKQQSTVHMAQRVIKRFNQIMNWHVERERGLKANPISKIVQKDLNKEIAKDEEFDKSSTISTTNVSAFLNYFKDSQLLIVFSFMALCGMRIAEALAVNWADIDFKNNVIYVHQQITDKGEIVKTKTKASTRYVPLPLVTKQELLKSLEENRTGLVTLNTQGNHIRPNNLRGKHFHKARKHLLEQNPDFDINTPHQFRKFFISYHIDNGTNIEVVSRWVGHADSNITRRIYAKPINETINHNADLMSGLLIDNKPHVLTFDKYSSRISPKVAVIK